MYLTSPLSFSLCLTFVRLLLLDVNLAGTACRVIQEACPRYSSILASLLDNRNVRRGLLATWRHVNSGTDVLHAEGWVGTCNLSDSCRWVAWFGNCERIWKSNCDIILLYIQERNLIAIKYFHTFIRILSCLRLLNI